MTVVVVYHLIPILILISILILDQTWQIYLTLMHILVLRSLMHIPLTINNL